jgi:hypothetical protein
VQLAAILADAPEPFSRHPHWPTVPIALSQSKGLPAPPPFALSLSKGAPAPPPFALSPSKGASTLVIPKGFDGLSPNGFRAP